ncbi:hypothetical protein V8E54_005076 [Elaphomyces granulatus]
MAIATTSGQSFLQLPYEIRVNIYRQLGVQLIINRHRGESSYIGVVFSRDLSGCDLKYRCIGDDQLVPSCIPQKLFHISRAVSADVLSVFWSENKFCLREEDLSKLLRLGSPLAWSSLRDLMVVFMLADSGIFSSWAKAKNAERLDCWREVCSHLGVHLPPSQLTLRFLIHCVDANADVVASVKNACSSMLELPVLKKVSLGVHGKSNGKFHGSINLGLQGMMTHLANRLVYAHLPTERKYRSPFRFMDLPAEIQCMILEHAGLVAPGPVMPWRPRGYVLYNCYTRRCPRCELCSGWVLYRNSCDPSQIYCWSLPADLFLINRHISVMSAEIFFSRNEFVLRPGLWSNKWAPKGLIWGLTHTGHDPSSPGTPRVRSPQSSKFLCAFPPECIPMLRFLTWHFPMDGDLVILSEELKADWVHAVDFIAQNVKPLSRLTITLDMCYNTVQHDMPTVSRDKLLFSLQKLQATGLRDLFVHLSKDRNLRKHAAEELRLERLAMGEGYHPTKEELESRIS